MAIEKVEPDLIERFASTVNTARVVTVSGLTSSAAKAFVIARLRPLVHGTIVLVTDLNVDLERFESDLQLWSGRGAANSQFTVASLPSFDTDIYAGISPHAETEERRAITLWQLGHNPADILVTTARSMATRTFSPAEFSELGAVLKVDQQMSPEQLTSRLARSGYFREDPLNNIGQFSVRGGIVDVWSPDAENPIRIEFFGDTVESIREFDPETQLSTNRVKSAALTPMREFDATPDALGEWASAAESRFPGEQFERNLRDRTDLAHAGETFSGWEFLLPLVRPRTATIFDHVESPLFIFDEPVAIERSMTAFYADLAERYRQTLDAGDIGLEPDEIFFGADELQKKISEIKRIDLRALGRSADITDEEFLYLEAHSPGSGTTSVRPTFLLPATQRTHEVEIVSHSAQRFSGDIRRFAETIHGEAPLVVTQTLGLAERLAERLLEFDAQLPTENIIIGNLSAGFEIPELKLKVYSETDIFGEVQKAEAARRTPQRRAKSSLSAFISDFRDLKPGDYIVHVDHGIGRFEGLQTIAAQGLEREFMLLTYAEGAKLFVPVERLDLVSRYSSGEAAEVTLDRLGGLGWQKTKAKAKRAMRDMADELLRLYAERKLVQGYAFSPDAPWQHEFEDAFPFDLTTDQAAAIEDVKSDMETPRPMDRLIIGDVGYGKTEVAMRAAFKAVMDGKQAAVLAPTTILAYQHFETFTKRFAAFPAKIELLSRFRGKKEQTAVVEAAAKGDVDVLIGTHRVLSNDVKLPNLGLVIVDEEQRFGVTHKEKLKHLKKKVDVLTLSATPIPRTLNMSLLGMRDMSVIETPPRDRLAINTQVVQFSENVIRSAVELELARHGQVFFIHNRVETIESVAALVQKIVPNARIAIGHGQMGEKEMEQIMLDFIDYKYDILVATTIIENGIDIPRANTIIINRADNYGLSQLYQLRGRVGRSNRRAYAYLLIPSEIELTPIARRRLSAMREFSDLGAGFRVAALDLELRGAGNILGGQQSGHLDALGFDLYTKMLERTIAELRGDEIADETSVSINLGIDVSIPKDYIVEASHRLRTYKRISSADSEATLVSLRAELEDRYGRVPESVDNLFAYGRLRKLAENLRITSIDRSGTAVAIKLSENAKISPERLMEFLQNNAEASFSPSGILRFETKSRNPIIAASLALEDIRT